MTNTCSRHYRRLDIRRRVKAVLGKLSGAALVHRDQSSRASHDPAQCFGKHRIVRYSADMSVGCFGECGFGSSGGAGDSPKRLTHPKVHCKFYPPIQTFLREKDPEKWYTDMVSSLAGVGEDPNQLTEYGEAPLCVAAHKAQGLVVAELLARDNIDPNIKGRHGRTPLYIAAEEGHVFVVKCLLAHSTIDVNSRNAPGHATPLMIASRRGHSRIVELLLAHPDCDTGLVDREGDTATRHARTESVKCRIHSYRYKSRSVDNVMTTPEWPSSAAVTVAEEANYHLHSLQQFPDLDTAQCGSGGRVARSSSSPEVDSITEFADDNDEQSLLIS